MVLRAGDRETRTGGEHAKPEDDYPTDLSKPADYALAIAAALAHDHGARLVILTVLPPPVSAPEVVLPPPVDDYKELALSAFRELEAYDPKMSALRVEAVVGDGSAGAEIIRAAKDFDADMIVMGTHGRTGLKRLLMGSVAEEVLRRVPCPVLT